MKTLAGSTIEEFRRRAFYMDGALIGEQILLFFKVDGSWHSIGFCDGAMGLQRLPEEPLLHRHGNFDAEFSYPTFPVEQLNEYVGRTIHATSLYKARIPTEDVFGIYISYGDGGFSFIEDANGDHCYFRDGALDKADEDFELVNTDILLKE